MLFADEEMRAFDASFSNHDKETWQVEYSQFMHGVDVETYGVAMAEFLGFNKLDALTTKLACRWHDHGKLHPETHDHRRRGPLTREQHIEVRKHLFHSGRYVTKLKAVADIQDAPLLEDVYFPVRFHDDPGEIPSPRLRYIGFVVRFSDVFVSCQERRHRIFSPSEPGELRRDFLGMTPDEALEVIELMTASLRFTKFEDDATACRNALFYLHAMGAGRTMMMIHNRG